MNPSRRPDTQRNDPDLFYSKKSLCVSLYGRCRRMGTPAASRDAGFAGLGDTFPQTLYLLVPTRPDTPST
jgi:hypothetical protein